jgi:hypothetical protein
VVVVLLAGDGEPGGPTTTATTPAGPGPPPPPPPAWGDFPGAPPELAVPPGGSGATVPAPGGERLTLRRADGSVLATAGLDERGAYLDARYFDRAGRPTVVIAALRARPASGGAVGARVRCGSAARADAGFRWTRFPIRWRLSRGPPPPGLRRAAALAAIRRARGTWNATRSHCRGLRDRSRARFLFRGASARRVGRDGVSVVDFGEVDRLGGLCAGAVACTITWISGTRATESDVRVDRADRGGFSVGPRPGPRKLDLESVMVHESGHTLGFDHVAARDVVMHAFIRRGSTSGRRLGRGDALASNAKY